MAPAAPRPLPEMQIVQHRDLNTNEARAITDRIKAAVGDLMILVAKAWQGRVWIALGYESWADYIKGEFSHAPLALPRDERRAVVALLRGQGMSSRAIAPAVGVDQKTVSNDLAREENSSPEPVPITGLDGKTYRPPEPTPESSMDDWAGMTIKFRAVKRNLEEVLGLAFFIRGFAEAHGQRDAVLEYVQEVRNLLDVIASLAQGESMDVELNRFLGEGA